MKEVQVDPIDESHHELFEGSMRESRLQNALLMNGVRFALITGFICVYNFAYFTDQEIDFLSTWRQMIVIWVVTASIFIFGRKSRPVLGASRFAVPLVDIPTVALIQYQNVVNTDNPDTTAVFTLALVIFLTSMSSFSLRSRHLMLTATVGILGILVVYEAAGLSFVAKLMGPMLILMTAGMMSWLPRRQNALAHEAAKKQAKRNRLARYFSPGVAEVIEDRDDPGEGESCEISVIFCDIRGFTRLSEPLAPAEVVQLLNEFHGRMVEEIFRFGGTLDKYLGDGLLAYFNAPVRQADHCVRAMRCSLAMSEALKSLNETRVAEGSEPLAIGLGIHAGEAVVGNIGASHRREFTAIGDTVNVASRLQSLTRDFECETLVSEGVVSHLDPKEREEFTLLEKGFTEVRGRREPLEIFVIEEQDKSPAKS